jgi:diguanylate cyclase (GGDEF)-like protein
MAYTAAAMYGGAALDEVITGSIPGDPGLAVVPVLIAAAVVVVLVLVGPRCPRWLLAGLGPLGVALIAQALVGAPRAGDAAVLYLWPVLWTSFFFGRRGAIAIVACIGVAHALVLLALPAASGYPGRWVEVMISASAVAVVVVMLGDRNDLLLSRLAGEARVDALTGLLNRRGFDERAALELARARREGAWVALATFDIDSFKLINDAWGHEVGDHVLARTGWLLACETRDIDVVARLGGDEFVALLPGADGADAEAFAERVRAVLAADHVPGLPGVQVSVGIDSALAPESSQAMRKRADAALYRVKRAGGDRTMVFA